MGQTVIFTIGMTALMIMSARAVMAGFGMRVVALEEMGNGVLVAFRNAGATPVPAAAAAPAPAAK